MLDDSSFDDLRTRLRAGDEAAAAEVFHRYSGRLIALARSHLNGKLRGKVDPEDIVQSALRSFYTRHAAAEIEVDDWNSLWALLSVITLRKCGAKLSLFTTARRDVRKEAPLAEGYLGQDGDFSVFEAMAHEPTPAEAAIFTDTLDQLLRILDEREQRILIMRLQGYTAPEISDAVRRTERTVHRVLARVRNKLERMDKE